MPVIIRNYLRSTMPVNRIRFKIDQRLSKLGRRKFGEYFDSKLSFVKHKEGFKNDIYAEITHENSHNDVCLQIADYVASSCYAMTERGIPSITKSSKTKSSTWKNGIGRIEHAGEIWPY